MRNRKHLLRWAAVLLAFGLVAAACGDDDDDDEDSEDSSVESEESSEAVAPPAYLGDGSLGVVTVEEGDAIQIRSLQSITGDTASFGLPIHRGTEIAVDDYGQIKGFDVDLGAGLDDLCSSDGGQAAAQTIVADDDVIGVLGTSCSGAAASAAPLITGAGMAMISAGNTSPSLTSDLAGTPGENYNPGYYRTAHNDLYQGAAMAAFVYSELDLDTAAAIHDGDPYTQGLAQAFSDAYQELGGEITGFTAVNKGDTDMVPVLTELAAASPGALFFPIFQPEGDFVADQASGVPGLEDTVLLAADGLLTLPYLSLPQTRGMYLSGPDQRFGENTNETTDRSADSFIDEYNSRYGENPSAAFWAHSYDATVLLLNAIDAASWVEDGHLMVDRQGVRDYLDNLSDYQGIIGNITCDDFGDCGAARITVVQNIGGEENAELSQSNVVYSYEPGAAGVGSEGLALSSDMTGMPLAEAVAAGLADVCPSTLVIQTDWFPESEHGSLYNLIGDDYEVDVDNQVVEGTMVLDGVDLGIRFQVRTGGPAIGFAPVSSYMYTDDSIHLGYATTDGQILRCADAPLKSVVAPREQNPQMIMWDPETYPDVESIADLGEENITVNVFGGGTFSEVFVAQGIWNPNQVDPSYNGQPARFVSEGGAIAQQGFASAEVYSYENIIEEWGRPVAYQTLHDAGFQVYSQTIGVRPDQLEEMRPCLERVVPIFQGSVVSFSNSPDRANGIIVDAVEQYEAGWQYTPDLAEFAVRTMREIGLVGNGPDGTVGNMELGRIQSVFDQILDTDLAANVASGLTAEDIFTNEFIDPNTGFDS
ncbi:MAG: branched-chain amino acid ABC transporter substrate-binding protein [Acidimicrobiaceae bacterium]|nr:branched-chain amino acid ABC transporter substrate-binding protein [Acidimicrobiaceae bacterium]